MFMDSPTYDADWYTMMHNVGTQHNSTIDTTCSATNHLNTTLLMFMMPKYSTVAAGDQYQHQSNNTSATKSSIEMKMTSPDNKEQTDCW